MKKSSIYLYLLFVFTATIVVLNRYTSFHITDYRVHFFFDFFAVSSFVIIVGQYFKKLQSNRSLIITTLSIGLLLFLKAFFTWGGDWKTQIILYRNYEDTNKTINFQMRADRFSFGYKDRLIAIYKLGPFMEWNTHVDTLGIDTTKWEKVGLKVNEMHFVNEE